MVQHTLKIIYAATLTILCAGASAVSQQTNWVGSWATSIQIPEPQNSLAPADLTDTTIRQIVHLSLGGPTIRVHLSNAFGTSALHLTSVHIGRSLSPASSAIDPGSDKALLFSGSPDVLIPPGAQYISDPMPYPTAAYTDLALTFHVDTPPSPQSGHPGSRATTWIAKGDVVSQTELAGAKTVEHWYVLSGVDVAASPAAFSVVALGDSITDGHAATTNGNDRWTDVLARRLHSQSIAVLNQGIGGNHLLTDGLGPNALARFDRDVLAQPGVRYVIVLEGINDLGALARTRDTTPAQHKVLVAQMIAAYQQMLTRAHAQHLTVIGATILPDAGSDYYHPTPVDEADRSEVNRWILAPGHFDSVVDLARIMADPADPTRLRPAYDSGDHLHPSPAGYKVMGDSFPPHLFKK